MMEVQMYHLMAGKVGVLSKTSLLLNFIESLLMPKFLIMFTEDNKTTLQLVLKVEIVIRVLIGKIGIL